MLTLGWLDAEMRGSNWKFNPAWRARLRMASVSGTSSMTISGTGSSGLAAGASAGAPPAGLSAGAAFVPAGSTFARSAGAVVAGAVAGAGAEGSTAAGVALSGPGAGGDFSWAAQSSVGCQAEEQGCEVLFHDGVLGVGE